MADRFEVQRNDLFSTRLVPDPHAPTARKLVDGEARLQIDRYALTANNVTYAAFGEAMKYWQFFPATEPAWGVVPVWGFAQVVESRAEGVTVGERVYGYFPMAAHLIVAPTRIGRSGFSDGVAHRAALPAIYNRYLRCAADPAYVEAREGLQAVLRPLFTTSFLIDDFLADQGFFGAEQILLSSASSKTAWGTAFCLSRRPRSDRPRIIGLTSARHLETVSALGCYDEVLDYGALETLDQHRTTAYVDMAGDAPLRRRIHEHWRDHLSQSTAVGGSHWQQLGNSSGLPGPRPTLFFAPAQAERRSAPPPEGLGADGLQHALAEAWTQLMAAADNPEAPWLRIQQLSGGAAIAQAWKDQVNGAVDPGVGLMLSP